jgi:hypothetical protein
VIAHVAGLPLEELPLSAAPAARGFEEHLMRRWFHVGHGWEAALARV